MTELRDTLYIVAFGLFILGLSGLTGPTTAVRGNRIAAAGMALAVVATLLRPEIHNWGADRARPGGSAPRSACPPPAASR